MPHNNSRCKEEAGAGEEADAGRREARGRGRCRGGGRHGEEAGAGEEDGAGRRPVQREEAARRGGGSVVDVGGGGVGSYGRGGERANPRGEEVTSKEQNPSGAAIYKKDIRDGSIKEPSVIIYHRWFLPFNPFVSRASVSSSLRLLLQLYYFFYINRQPLSKGFLSNLLDHPLSLHKFQMASSLVPAVLAYILVVYSHLSGRNLAQAANKASVRNTISCRPSHLPETITAIIGRLELLLQQTSARLSSIRRVNLVAEIVLWNYLVRTEDATQRVEDDLDIAGERVRLAETLETRVDDLWAIWDLIMESEHLQEEIERVRSQVEAFGETVADPAPTEADEKAYEDLKPKIGSLILFLSSVM